MEARLITGTEADHTERIDKGDKLIIYDEKFSRQLWKFGKILEYINRLIRKYGALK